MQEDGTGFTGIGFEKAQGSCLWCAELCATEAQPDKLEDINLVAKLVQMLTQEEYTIFSRVELEEAYKFGSLCSDCRFCVQSWHDMMETISAALVATMEIKRRIIVRILTAPEEQSGPLLTPKLHAAQPGRLSLLLENLEKLKSNIRHDFAASTLNVSADESSLGVEVDQAVMVGQLNERNAHLQAGGDSTSGACPSQGMILNGLEGDLELDEQLAGSDEDYACDKNKQPKRELRHGIASQNTAPQLFSSSAGPAGDIGTVLITAQSAAVAVSSLLQDPLREPAVGGPQSLEQYRTQAESGYAGENLSTNEVTKIANCTIRSVENIGIADCRPKELLGPVKGRRRNGRSKQSKNDVTTDQQQHGWVLPPSGYQTRSSIRQSWSTLAAETPIRANNGRQCIPGASNEANSTATSSYPIQTKASCRQSSQCDDKDWSPKEDGRSDDDYDGYYHMEVKPKAGKNKGPASKCRFEAPEKSDKTIPSKRRIAPPKRKVSMKSGEKVKTPFTVI